MRSKEAFAYSRSTGYFCSVAADHPAPCRDGPELLDPLKSQETYDDLEKLR